ncbi:hypothetical protein [Kitasatospora sp. NBC_01266]|uniref:hypothetical protein n=1 Tax=Kitasatospora sp. NBC_01266 TaxID=2903572 RepID=UPI002E358FCA|nr:hypothetical protein [Kitasatospora sp. NBC_01266]
MTALRIALTGHSGSGKSTCTDLIEEFAAERGLGVHRVPLARPLYQLQQRVYAHAGVGLAAGAQDQLLLEDLAGHLRRINPRSLADDFLARVELGVAEGADILLNDDLRDPQVDAPALRAASFRVLRITCEPARREERLALRGDLTRTDRSTSRIELITPDAVIDNSADLGSYRVAVHQLLGSWL